MGKQKRWQLFLIIAVISLTIYNILPTLFFYSKPLKKPIDEKQALQVAAQATERVANLEKQSVDWLASFCSLIQIKPTSIAIDKAQPQLIHLQFKNLDDAAALRKHLPRAGALIHFAPAQLALYDQDSASKTVTVQRKIPLHINEKEISSYYQFGTKLDKNGKITDLYRGLVEDRVIELASTLAGASDNALYVQAALQHPNDPQSLDLLITASQNLLSFVKVFDEHSPIAKRYYASFSQADEVDRSNFSTQFLSALELGYDKIKLERISVSSIESASDPIKQQRLEALQSREAILTQAIALVKKHSSEFSTDKAPWTFATVGEALREAKNTGSQTVSLADHHPLIKEIFIDWSSDKITLNLFPDILEIKNSKNKKEQVDHLLYNEMAAVSRTTGEIIKPLQNQFEIQLTQLSGSQSFLALRIYNIAGAQAKQLYEMISAQWHPKHPDLSRDSFPIYDYETYQALSPEEKKLGLVVFAPTLSGKMPPKGLKMSSIYVIAKGVDKILQKVSADPHSESAKKFLADFKSLSELLQKNGYSGYSGNSYAIARDFTSDFIFEHEEFYQPFLKATCENFTAHGTKRYAVLEFTNIEQRLLTTNKIEDKLHEDLIKWRDDYRSAQVDIRGTSRYDIAPPTKSIFWNNFKLSLKKYFRGDERKVLHWGLDMSGGKTVQIELRDQNNLVVTHEADIKQGINELFSRVNKMGVSEVSIRQEGHTIALDFPGSQSLSASELVKASTMYFHVVNEKFMGSPALAEASQRFLQEVWNEAVVTNRKDPEEINRIATRHLYGDNLNSETVQPRSLAAKTLYDAGLRLAADNQTSRGFDQTLSKIALLRGDEFTEWHGQTHPLLIVFRNYAIEGSNLENVYASYDASKGNFLAFSVKAAPNSKDTSKESPRDHLETWTSRFCKEKIAGSLLESFSRGRGWRMAVLLNGTVITAPALESTLRDNASITGSFTQREISKLEADLKAGSLSFTPRILSEKNVSPELGSQERTHGIIAMVLALALVIVTMVSYYRFGGVIASIAVLLNLLILWAALQNIGATMTLAGIAGVILTVAMAVDANVLVFERIREEFAITGRIASAMHAGYRKALSAIIDSNITTIIAALILLNFDSGPIRGFALTLIIGIVSSLFSSLFMTRFFFAGWVQNPQNKELKMASLIKSSSFDFLKYTKPTLLISAVVIVIGSYFVSMSKDTLLGMDFTGGYALTVELPLSKEANYRSQVEHALIKKGLSSQDFQVRELNPSHHVRIFLGQSLEKKGHPFYQLSSTSGYENNPKIAWVISALKNDGITLTPTVLETLENNWTAISGQMSDTMRTNAIIGIALALLCILAYITIRFEFKYGISAMICLAHDVLFCLGAMAILHKLGVAIQIDLHTVAALMTIVGYSLNDTIIVFDRIREDVRGRRHQKFSEIINHALNVTLSRTLMTSGITLLVLIPIIALGGSTIFGFALVMAIGVIFGTLSSLFIAAPLMHYFHRREIEKHEKLSIH